MIGPFLGLAAVAVLVGGYLTFLFNKSPRILRVLIRVDGQNDFCPGGNLPVPEGNLIVAIINKLSRLGKQLGFYDLIIDTQDSHPENHGSFFTQHPGLAAFAQTTLNGLTQVLWTVHCVVGTWGWQFHPELDRSMVDKTVLKGQDPRVDSYSGFYDNGRDAAAELKEQYPFLGQSTGLAEYILAEAERRNCESIMIDVVGLAFRFCVSYTAKDARSLTYRGKQVRVRVIIDATKAISFTEGDVEQEIRDLGALGIEIVNSDVVLNEMHPPLPTIMTPFGRLM
ncbi:MAG TPA: isochorismatase family protein [Oculatellaceae cyanobacterium]